MTYRGVLWLLVVIATIALFIAAIGYRIWHPQPVYDRYLGSGAPPCAGTARLATGHRAWKCGAEGHATGARARQSAEGGAFTLAYDGAGAAPPFTVLAVLLPRRCRRHHGVRDEGHWLLPGSCAW